jgi:metallo-beta-lactamase family protein
LKIQFLGAAQQVTGSCYYVEAGGLRLLVDCGLFQERATLERNWAPFPVPPDSLDYVLLTHVHLDHSGLLPKLVREGFAGEILATAASADLLPLVLLDSARVQEEDAAYKKKRHQKEGRRGPHPEIPLYTEAEASRVSDYLHPVSYQTEITLKKQITARLHEAGHILGSAMIELSVREKGRTLSFLFSGDIGQRNKPLVRDPAVFEQADAVIMESTYGERNHQDPADIETMMTGIIKEAAGTGGNVVIPVFAVERAQELLFHLSRLVRKKLIPRLPVFLDSPMASDVTEVFLRHPECFDRETSGLFRSGQSPFEFAGLKITRTADESRAINSLRQPAVIMAGSGMCTGGRIKHHLRQNISRPESTILFVGYQAVGTLGRQIQEGRPEVRIFGELHPLRARIREIHAFSGHADRDGLLAWVGHFREPRPLVFLTHGEKEAADSLANTLREGRGFIASVPGFRDSWRSDGEIPS